MGRGFGLICRKCRYEFGIHLGVGFGFPQNYQNIMEAAKAGKLGREVRYFLRENPEGTLDCSQVLLQCTVCDSLERGIDLSMYIPKDQPYVTKGNWSVAFSMEEFSYYDQVFENDPDEFRFYCEHDNDEEFCTHVFKYCRMPLEERPHPIREQAEWLIQKGISVNAVNWEAARGEDGIARSVESPLLHAVEHRDYCMIKFLLENGADPAQRLFAEDPWDPGYEDYLIEDMDVRIMNGDRGDSMMLDLEIASLLMQYGLDQWEGGQCIEVDKKNRRIRGRGPQMQH